ncbi:hypothetical protein GTP58_08110 [Duganella sp. CY15W]|uniref:substrate-binding domain-containing protein n=1 Tax=Duganella sp. CY15W TaxID=2692172 RepID=UPI00136F249B|nr:substrate-binding domain-containing protein [Duganella sp. CY15W]MYM28285.1 hypothetical protein [Duganella sp. CY15W]
MNAPLPRAPLPEAAAALQLTGSTTLQPYMQLAAEAYMQLHDVRVVINGGCGSARGFKALIDGTTDIAMASGPASESIVSAAVARGAPLHATIIRRDAILAVVHPSNPVQALTLRQLNNIFTGRTTNWHAVGGLDRPIEVLVGPPAGGVSISWRQLVLGSEDTYTASSQVLGAAARLAQAAARPDTITFMPQMAVLPARVKALRIDGLAAESSPQQYPLYAPMMLVTLGPPSPAATRFMAHAARTATAPARGESRE